MWGTLIRLVTPFAWDVVRERLLPERRAPALPPPPAPHVDLEARLARLETRVEALGETAMQRADEVTRLLQLLALRATVALWLAIASVVTSVVTLIVVIVRR